jgi:uncharacterized protein (UPF0333 family)
MKKGQAAMEFLMTYGWAILAAIIAIAVLAYFGVFSPSRYVPETCIMNAPWGCGEESKVVAGTSNDTVTLKLTNGGGDAYTINAINITGCRMASDAPSGNNYTVGESKNIAVTCLVDAGSAGDRFRGDITIAYQKTSGGSSYDLVSSGNIVRKIR